MNKFVNIIENEELVILDGAMGSLLIAQGLQAGESPENWNLTNPEKIITIHSDYIQAGSMVILTNSFGGNWYRLRHARLEAKVIEINITAGNIAREAAEKSERMVAVGGSIGPTGELLKPIGILDFDEAVDVFSVQAQALKDGGVDVLWIETMSDVNELRAAILGAKTTKLPIVATMTFEKRGRTMMGNTANQFVQEVDEQNISAIGANCGKGPDIVEGIISDLAGTGKFQRLVSKANAGLPKIIDGRVVYDGSAELMAEHAVRVHKLGATLIGACCGSTPAHIRSIVAALTPYGI